MLWKALELCADDHSRVHATYSFRGEDVPFYAGERQVEGGNSPGVDTVEVRFGGSEGDQGRKEAVLVGAKGDDNKGGEIVEMLQELYQKIEKGKLNGPLTASRSHGGERRGGREDTTVREEISLYSGRIRDATKLVKMAASPLVIQQEER